MFSDDASYWAADAVTWLGDIIDTVMCSAAAAGTETSITLSAGAELGAYFYHSVSLKSVPQNGQ